MWFSVVCTLIDNDTRHHSDQNLLWTHKAQNVFFFQSASFFFQSASSVVWTTANQPIRSRVQQQQWQKTKFTILIRSSRVYFHVITARSTGYLTTGVQSSVGKKMAAVYFTTIPCKPYIARKVEGKQYFCDICPCVWQAVCSKIQSLQYMFNPLNNGII